MKVSMLYTPPVAFKIEFRNFNLCPHCEQQGEDPLLLRLSEGIPMISRSDGKNFHLLLANRPLAYPAERAAGPAQKLSLCFWYSRAAGIKSTKSSLVLVPANLKGDPKIFRVIELIADLLTDKLLQQQPLGAFYDLQGNALRELSY
jgi:hypothetical protein